MNLNNKDMETKYNYEMLSEWGKGDLVWLVLEMQEKLNNK